MNLHHFVKLHLHVHSLSCQLSAVSVCVCAISRHAGLCLSLRVCLCWPLTVTTKYTSLQSLLYARTLLSLLLLGLISVLAATQFHEGGVRSVSGP